MAVIAVTGIPAAGVNYTVTTASSADWASVSNSTYFYDLTDKLVHYKDSTGTILEIFGTGGGVNIYNTDGTLTADRTVSGNSKILTLDNVRREVHNVVPNFNDATGFIINVDAGALSPFLTSRMFRIVDTTTTTEKFGINVDGNVIINNAYALPTVAPTSGQVLGYLGVGTTQWTTATGGLTYFTEAQSTASPNATVNVDSLTAVASTTNADFAIVSKGTGALTRQIPDGTATGGNKRGTYSVDLQTDRFNASNVASGSYSSLLGGQANTSSGSYSTVIGGYANSATAQYSTAIGANNQARGETSLAGGSSSVCYNPNDFVFGNTCIISSGGYYSNVNMGKSNTINSGLASTVFGESNIISNFYQFAAGNNHRLTSGSGSASLGISTMDDGYGRSMYGRAGWVRGDTQSSKIILNRRTTDATASVLVIDSPAGNTPVVGNQMTLQNNNSFRFKGTIIARQSGSTNTSAWDIDGIIQRGVGVGTTTLLISNVNIVQNTPAWGTPTLTANTTLGCLTISVIGALITNIQWTCAIDTTEVIYA